MGICAHKAQAERQQEVMEWPPQVEEESVVEVAKAVADTAEAVARERLQSDIPISHDELVKLIKLAELKPVTTRRSSKVVGQERVLRMWIFGAFVHGGKNGLTSLLRQRPHLARAIARYMVGKSSEPFATVVITENVAFIPHRDPNDGHYKTTISGLTSFCGGQLWTENVGGEYDDHTVWRYVREGGKALPGRLHQLADGRSTTFQGTAWHGTEPYEGNRMVCIAYMPRNWKELNESDLGVLSKLGFRIPSDVRVYTHATSEEETQSSTSILSQQQREEEVKSLLACKASISECDFATKFFTIEEKRTLGQSSKHMIPEDDHHHDASQLPHSTDDDDDVDDEGLKVEGFKVEEVSHPGAPVEPWDLEHLKAESTEDHAVKDLWKCCREGIYQKGDESSLRARGHRRPHRKLSGQDIGEGVVSVDLSGPHKRTYAGNKFAVVVCAHLREGVDLPFVRGIPNKEAKTVTDALRDVLLQLVSLAGGDQITFRIHSDQGKEFVAKIAHEDLKTFNHFRTFAVPYSHQSNGRIEQLIDSLKTSTASFLLSGQLDVRFWDEVMVHAAKLKRMRQLRIPIPKDLPIPGDYVLVRKPVENMPSLEDRTERGMFLGLTDHISNGSKVAVQRDERVVVRFARLPILLNQVKPRWHVITKPDSGENIWVSDRGHVAFNAPGPEEILTVEQKQGGHIMQVDDVLARLRQLLDRTRTPDSVRDIFNLYGHGLLVQEETAEAHQVQCEESEESFGHMFMRAVACRAVLTSTKLEVDKPEKYITRTDEEEHETEEIFQQLMREAEQRRGSAEVVPNSVLTGEQAERWISAVRKELASVENKEVLLPVRVGHEREDLQLEAGEEIPRTIPMKLVLSEKPLAAPGSTEEGIGEQVYIEKARLVACGNFQNNEFAKDELSTENVPPWIVRTMYHKLAQEPSWIAGAADISTAFLNTVLQRGEAPLLEPPAIPLKALYGLRISPKEWSRDRDATLNGSVIKPRTGDMMPAVRLEPLDICEGLWRIIDTDTGALMGLLTLYVDDTLIIACPEVVSRCLEYIGQKWTLKLQGYISRKECDIKCGELGQLERKAELVFLGVQVSFNAQGDVIINQRAWVLQELHRRQWLHLKGCTSLPQLELDDDEVKDEAYEQNKLECQRELGTLLWMSTRSRPDIASTVGILASELTHRPKRVLQLLRHAWRYIRGTLDVCLTYKMQQDIQEFTSFAPTAGRSRSGMVYMIGSSILDWASTKQTLTAWSATEAETVAMSECLSQGGRMQSAVDQLLGHALQITLRCDNSAAIILALRESFQPLKWKTQGVALRASWLRDSIHDLGAAVIHEPGEGLVADLLTKTLPRVKSSEFVHGCMENTVLHGEELELRSNVYSSLPMKAAQSQAPAARQKRGIGTSFGRGRNVDAGNERDPEKGNSHLGGQLPRLYRRAAYNFATYGKGGRSHAEARLAKHANLLELRHGMLREFAADKFTAHFQLHGGARGRWRYALAYWLIGARRLQRRRSLSGGSLRIANEHSGRGGEGK
ncbi:Retrovirus-related Pol polyprotein from transposon TNT 1-94 [Symbiodinium microadriaticum]|uniref:Retrovirus-related Pol polyprotein from transposon TNT 1-94 n=1 Tax=Symbiodinium microadriaticum TaxID=2951 RepID=A0A1Q9DXD5_SYMMI|nr:Retrovirus-related Pol polyprotein from transposon TNT 1-94 [Symbiodinium microadriaticum]